MAGKVLVKSQFKSDGRGGLVLRAWVEGRLWPIDVVRTRPFLWDHAVGCADCKWDHTMIELCQPGLGLDGFRR